MKHGNGAGYMHAIRDHLALTGIIAGEDATIFALQRLAEAVGIPSLDGLSIPEFFARKKHARIDELIASYADQSPALATDINAQWQNVKVAALRDAEDLQV